MANRFYRSTGDGAWGTSTNWSTTNGGGADAATPTNADAVFFTSLSAANCTLQTTPKSCASIDCTGYTGTMTFSQTLTTQGSVTFSAGMTIAGANALIASGTGTWTSNGKWSNSITLASGTFTITFADNWTCNNFTTQTTGTKTLNGNILTINGNFTIGVAIQGTTNIVIAGSGTWTGASASVQNNITINTAGTFVISGTVFYNTGTLTYTAGTVTTTGSLLNINGSCTLNTAGIVWADITLITAVTITVTNNSLLTMTGTLTHGQANSKTWAGTAGFTCNSWILQGTAASNHTLGAGLTYTVTSLLQAILASGAAFPTIKSGTGGVRANLTLTAVGTCSLGYIGFTDIDASGGEQIDVFNGTLSNTVNIRSYTDPAIDITKSFAA
jgi:hypothetical protein